MSKHESTIVRIANCRIFDGVSPDVKDDMDVIIDNDRIREVSDKPSRVDAAITIDARRRTLMPGLIDAHFHAVAPSLDARSSDLMPPSLLAQHARVRLESALLRGFTTVRDAGGADCGLAIATEQGLIAGPRLLFSGKALSQTGGHGDLRDPKQVEPCVCSYRGHFAVTADGVDEVRKAAREQLRKGAHQIKIVASGGVASPADPLHMTQYRDDEIFAAVAEARARDTYVMAHCHSTAAIRRCIKLGVRSIEHGTFLDDETAKLAAGAGAWVVPTLVILDDLARHGAALGLPPASVAKINEVGDAGMRALEACRRHGVKTGFGTDLIGDLHVDQCREFLIRRDVFSPFEILRSATAGNAELLDRAGELGVVRAGASADLLLVERDPLADLAVFTANGEHVALIMKSGKIYKNAL